MRPPRTLAIALTSLAATALFPAFAGDQPKPEQIQIEVDLSASLQDKIRSIRAQSRKICTPRSEGVYAAARNAIRRDCQKQIVADVLAQLADQGMTNQTEN